MVRNMIICSAGLCQYLIDAYPEVRLMLVVAQAYPVPDSAEHLDCQWWVPTCHALQDLPHYDPL